MRYVAELCESAVPVYGGAQAPLCRPATQSRAVEPIHAVDAIVQIVEPNPGLTLVTLGPLTNVALALALARQPSIAANVGVTEGPISFTLEEETRK